MENAVQIHEIVKNIIKFLPYQDVKNVRLVNKLWNNEANPILREKTGSLFEGTLKGLESYVTNERKLAIQDLLVRLPFELTVFSHDGSRDGILIQTMKLPPVWFPRVKVLCLPGFRTVEMNRLLPHMLHMLPCLEVLEWQSLAFRGEDRFQQLKLEAVPEEVQFSLVSITVPFSSYCGRFETGLDPGFLRRCPKLKSFAASLCIGSPTPFLNFFESWKAIRSADMRYELLHFISTYSGWEWESDQNSRIVHSLVEFISINQPKSLTLVGDFLDLELMADNEGRWTSMLSSGLTGTSIRSLEVPVADEHILGHSLKNLRKCAAFAKVTALTLNVTYHRPDWVRPLDTGSVLHNLDQVTSLTILGSLPAFENWTEIVKHLPNVSSLALARGSYDGASKSLCKGLLLFDGLQELSWVIPEIWEPEERLKKLLQNKRTRVEGCLDNIMTLKRLRKLKLTVHTDDTLKPETLMLLLFGEYLHEPQMELEIDRCVYPSKDGHARCSRGKIRLSPEEFKKALKQASDTVKILEEQEISS